MTVVENTGKGEIYSRMIAVMRAVGAVGKNSRNTQQQYNFRGVDDVYAELHQHMAEHGVFAVPEVLEEKHEERTTQKGTLLIYRILKVRYTFYAPDGSSVQAVTVGEGMDSGDKASNKAMSGAHKYCLVQAFTIPTAEPKDSENDSPDPKPKAAAKAAEGGAAPKASGKTAKEKPKPFQFDKGNREHLQMLVTALEHRKIPVEFHDEVAVALHGKSTTEIDSVIAAVKAGPTNG